MDKFCNIICIGLQGHFSPSQAPGGYGGMQGFPAQDYHPMQHMQMAGSAFQQPLDPEVNKYLYNNKYLYRLYKYLLLIITSVRKQIN